MREDEKLFSFGSHIFIVTLLLVAIFHALFSADEKKLDTKNRKIITLEQDIANAQVKFSALTQPDVLRPIVLQIYPDWKPIGTGRTIDVTNWN